MFALIDSTTGRVARWAAESAALEPDLGTMGDRIVPVVTAPVPAGRKIDGRAEMTFDAEAGHVVRSWPTRPVPIEEALEDVRRARAAAYPPIGDQLDALWKGGADMEAMRTAVMAVKARFPKPVPAAE